MNVQVEIIKPLFMAFSNNLQTGTGLNTAHFQRGMAKIPDEVALGVTELILERALAEPEQALAARAQPMSN